MLIGHHRNFVYDQSIYVAPFTPFVLEPLPSNLLVSHSKVPAANKAHLILKPNNSEIVVKKLKKSSSYECLFICD